MPLDSSTTTAGDAVSNLEPPSAYTRTPATTALPAGTSLFRIHQKRFPAQAFNPVPSHRYYGGGRFDSTHDDRYGYLYAGEKPATAIAETMLRDLPFDDTGARQLPAAAYQGRRISALTVQTDLELVDLRTSPALAQVAQDTWLTMADPRDYAQTRHWGHWIRSKSPSAAGYVWYSRREVATLAYVLFEDRIPSGAIDHDPHNPGLPTPDEQDFDTPRGNRHLRRLLGLYNVAIARP